MPDLPDPKRRAFFRRLIDPLRMAGTTLEDTEQEMLPCPSCGQPSITALAARRILERTALPPEAVLTCATCKREGLGTIPRDTPPKAMLDD